MQRIYLRLFLLYSLRLNKLLKLLYKRISIKSRKSILLLIALLIIKVITRVLSLYFSRINYIRFINFALMYFLSTYLNFKNFL